MRLILATSSAPGIGARQAFVNRVHAHWMPPWVRILHCWLPGEPHIDGGVMLPRDATFNYSGARHLAFIRDLIDAAADEAAEGDWVGVVNDDVVLMPKFYVAFESEVAPRKRMLIGRVSDMRGLQRLSDEEAIEKLKTGVTTRRNPGSCDLLAMPVGEWPAVREAMPDFLLGETCWDTWVINRYGRDGLTSMFGRAEMIHPVHPSGSHKDSPTRQHNERLYIAAYPRQIRSRPTRKTGTRAASKPRRSNIHRGKGGKVWRE